MADGPERNKPAQQDPVMRVLIGILYTLPYVFILYVLSIGPMYWTIYRAYRLEGSPLIRVLYYPLVRASEFDYVSNFFDWYIGFWI